MQDFSGGGGPTLKFQRFWIYMPCREQRSCEPLLGGSKCCVLRAIFNHFHGKKSSQKIINKHEFFH